MDGSFRNCIGYTHSKLLFCITLYRSLLQSSSSKAIVVTLADKFLLFQALNFLVESFGLLSDLFPFPSILDAGCPVFYLHLADVLFDVIIPSVLGSSL